jgi:chromosome segregation ATPase
VKRGESSSTITITLSSGTETRPTTTTVCRRISTDNKSEWKINGARARTRDVACGCHARRAHTHQTAPLTCRLRVACIRTRAHTHRPLAGAVVTLGKVQEVVAALNIQLDNLCQFLPQDRVVAFAQMSPCELLLETEKAFGSRELHEQHTSLIGEKQSMKDLEGAVAAHAASLERLRGINSGLERDVERFNARAELTAKADMMKKKLPWLRYEDARGKHDEAKEALAAGKKSVRALKRTRFACVGALLCGAARWRCRRARCAATCAQHARFFGLQSCAHTPATC